MDRLPQVIDTFAGERRDFYDPIAAGQFAYRFFSQRDSQVAFVDGVETDRELVEQFNLFMRESRGRFDDGDDHVGLADRGLRSFDADLFDNVFGIPDSRSVYQVYRDAVDDEEMIHVTREVGSSQGLFVAPEGAACFAALKSLFSSGKIAS